MPVFNMMQGGGSNDYGTLPQQITNFKGKSGNSKITLTWENPNDLNFSGVLIRRKTTGYPTNPSDGSQIYNGSAQTVDDSGLTNGTTYYYRAFAYNSNQEYQTIECFISIIPVPYHVYGVCIDTKNSNPETSVTYIDDAIGMTGGSADWNSIPIFANIKPCLLKNGVVQYYLNPDDLTKKADGTDSVLTGADGDVMVEIPKMGLKMVNDSANNKQYVSITNDPNATSQGFHYYAHTRDTEGDRDKLYIGCYLGYSVNNTLHSYSGITPTNSMNLTIFRTIAHANGTGYDLVSFYPLILLQALYLIKYKNLNSQTALGQGYTNGSSIKNTGATNTLGRDYGTTSTTQQVCFQNIEDFWGNLYWYIDGFYCDSNHYIFTAKKSFSDSGSGYQNLGQISTSNLGGYISSIQGTSEMGFIPNLVSGSSTTYYCDTGFLYSNTVSCFGGSYNGGAPSGIFYFYCMFNASSSNSIVGARLMYL